MVGWQVTATTIHCEWVDEDVTIMVYKDGSAKCTGYSKFREHITKELLKLLKEKGKNSGKKLHCVYPAICGLDNYRDKIMTEEAGYK